MNALPPVLATAAISLVTWRSAWIVARSRGITLGSTPPALFAGVAIAAYAGTQRSLDLATIAVLAFVTVAAAADARCGAIFDVLTLSLAVAATTCGAWAGSLRETVAGATLTGGALLAVYLATARRGIGLGDVKLAAGVGAGLGPTLGTAALGAAFAFGGTYGAWLIANGRAHRGDRLPFGPFVALGTYAAVLLGDPNR